MHTLHYTQNVPISLQECWDFFSSPDNLKILTPEFLGFSDFDPQKTMYEGQIIQHQIRPILGIPMRWVTEITHIDPLNYFIDEQRFGPYKFWHHEHRFKKIAQGVEIIDSIHYIVPFGKIGEVINRLKIRKDIDKIFNYRRQKIIDLFGEYVG